MTEGAKGSQTPSCDAERFSKLRTIDEDDRSVRSEKSTKSTKSTKSEKSTKSAKSTKSSKSTKSAKSTKSSKSYKSNKSYKSTKSGRSTRSTRSKKDDEPVTAFSWIDTQDTFVDPEKGVATTSTTENQVLSDGTRIVKRIDTLKQTHVHGATTVKNTNTQTVEQVVEEERIVYGADLTIWDVVTCCFPCLKKKKEEKEEEPRGEGNLPPPPPVAPADDNRGSSSGRQGVRWEH